MAEPGPATQRRGDRLREHILMSAKDLFLENGLDRTSMDAVASRAHTSKRSLYAHFANKETLFLAVLELVRELFGRNLQQPSVYADDGREAVVLFCARFLQLMTWDSQIRVCRLAIAEAARLPESSRAYFDAMFATAYDRLADHLDGSMAIPRADAGALAERLLGTVALPRVLRTVFGVEDAGLDPPTSDRLARDVDMPELRRRVEELLPAG